MKAGNDTEALAAFAAMLRFDDLPSDAVMTIKRMVLDSLGTALAATTLGDGCAESMAVMERLGGPPEATILGTKTKIAATGAAFANGALVHALNYDPMARASAMWESFAWRRRWRWPRPLAARPAAT